MRRSRIVTRFATCALALAPSAHAVTGTCDAVPLGPVEIESSAGTAAGVPKSYANLGAAFAAINAGVLHQGAISIDVCTGVSEGTAPATLNSSGAGSASYASVTIRPVTTGLTISGNPLSGFGVIQLNGADNVTIDGDNPNTAGTNRDLTIVNTSAPGELASSVIRIATSTAVTSANNNTFKNLVLNGNVTDGNSPSVTNSATVSFGVYVGGNGGAVATAVPFAITTTPAGVPSGATVNGFVVHNNAINRCATGVHFNGLSTSASSDVTITNNVIGATGSPMPSVPPYSAPVTTVYVAGVNVSGTNAVAITGNTVQNVISYIRTSHVGIGLRSIGSGTVAVRNNTITGVVENDTVTVTAEGIDVQSVAGAYSIEGNTVRDVQNSSTSTTARAGGIVVSTPAPAGTIERNRVERVHARRTSGACGVCLEGGSNIIVRNNLISDVNQNASDRDGFVASFNPVGLKINAGTGHRIYHNTVNMFGPLLGGAGGGKLTAAFALSAAYGGIDVRNNIFANSMTGGPAATVHVAVYLPSSAPPTMNLTWNNNAYFTGSIYGMHGVAQVGLTYAAEPAGAPNFAGLYAAAEFDSTSTSATPNFRSYTSTLGNASSDSASFATTTTPPFVSNVDLHIVSDTLTQLESSGADVAVTNDFDDEVRSVSTPDIGADEYAGTFADVTGPIITYTPLAVTSSVANRVLSTNVVDALSGVPATGIGLPRIYFRKGLSGPFSSKECVHGIGSAYDCEIDYTLASGGGVTAGDIIQYYVGAQDAASVPNVVVRPYVGSAELTSDPPAAGTPPTAPSQYAISGAVAGTISVGAGGHFPSLSSAGGLFEFLNVSVLSGDVTVHIISDLSAETGEHALNEWSELGPGRYRLTIKPDGAPRVVSGNTAMDAALIKLNGADRVTIDGSLSTPPGTDRSLTLTNSNIYATAIWIASADNLNGASDNVVQNCRILGVGENNVQSSCGIKASGASVGGDAEAPNSNNHIHNNAISKIDFGVIIRGVATTRDQNWLITGNVLGSDVFADRVRNTGLTIKNAENFEISRNLFSGIGWGVLPSGPIKGLEIGTGIVKGVIEANTINDVRHPNGSFISPPAVGLDVNTGTATSALTIRNNSISGIFAYGAVYGISINGSGGIAVHHNSVNLYGSQPEGNRPDALEAALFVGSSATALDVQDNVFRNSFVYAGPGGRAYAAYSAASASAFTKINFNSYYATGTRTSLGFLGGIITTMSGWKAATGQDANSIDPAVEPGFVSSTYLRPIFGAPVLYLGNPVGVLEDITKASRSVTTPSIGAFEHPTCGVGNVCNDNNPCTTDTCVLTPDMHCESILLSEGTSCGDSDNSACNAADSCNATGTCVDRKKPASTVCRPGDASGCDPADVCDGVSNACVPVVAAELTACGNPDNTSCNAPDSCNATGACIDRKKPASFVCLPSSGDCDLDDLCDGVEATCPADTDDASAPVGNSLQVSHDPETEVSTISWTEVMPGPFNVYRGSHAADAPWMYNHSCFVQGSNTQSTSDSETPDPGQLFYYLISRDDASCPESSLGLDSGGSNRPNGDACD